MESGAPSKPRKSPPMTLGVNPAPTSRAGDDPELEPPLPKVRDSYGRLVSTKKANQPFLAYGKWKKEQAQKEAQAKDRAERRARGEEVEEDEDEILAAKGSSAWSAVKTLIWILLAFALAGKFVTGSFTWGYDASRWTNPQTYLQFYAQKQANSGELLFSDSTLAKFDGSNPKTPIYVAVDGEVYDVTEGRRHYGPGGAYHALAGKDAARAFGTGCFKEHLTHDLRGLDQAEQDGVAHWRGFFASHKKYFKVGRVIHRPINPSSPIPEHCEPEKNEAQKKRLAAPKGGKEKVGGEL